MNGPFVFLNLGPLSWFLKKAIRRKKDDVHSSAISQKMSRNSWPKDSFRCLGDGKLVLGRKLS